ncbi:MAG: DUF1638 domain-containing protein [Phycisphaerae bacterium]|nr:DUF1638 domain-containing protein [Phycisphaerae bacterium]
MPSCQNTTAEDPRGVHVIACGVLAVDLKAVAERLNANASMEFLPGGLHRSPSELRTRLQEAVDRASAERRGDVIAIGYGVCGRGTVGIHARNVPLILPRVHDCIALFLGSDAAYREQFAKFPGTYYIAAGWVEENAQPQSMSERTSVRVGETRLEFEELVARHGRDNAEAIRHFLNSWQRNYQRAAFIDTGAGGARRRYVDVARAMAEEFGWRYEELEGRDELLVRLLTARHSADDVLIVPPHHVTTYDPLSKGLRAVPVWESQGALTKGRRTLVFDGTGEAGGAGPVASAGLGDRQARLGLGIDAGGTYTDAVIYDFRDHTVVQKAKALTTKADFTIGIGGALDQLDADRLSRVDLVSLSTTLATNAIVEGRGQTVGLLIMPPYGRFNPSHIDHQPVAGIDGQMEIDGTEIAPIDPDQVRRVMREMIDRHRVGAFAVTGYGSSNNPSHELQVKSIIRQETDLSVTCGHEVSELLNYRVRAATAALNARIIPYLETLIDEVGISLRGRGIEAPIMVVRSDGSLMSFETARQRPIETILSGPAASVAGASYLARVSEAIVVDIGGTTTDTARIRDGAVATCEAGASVGRFRTHVKALDMRTLGLGGDSLIAIEKRQLRIGPQRVAPISWLSSRHADVDEALDWLGRRLDRFDGSTRGMDLISLNGQRRPMSLSDEESRILDALAGRPLSVDELAERLGSLSWRFVPLARLEDNHVIQRCGLTPTDLLHVTGRLSLWDVEASRRASDLYCRLTGLEEGLLAERVLKAVVDKLAVEILKKQLDDRIDAEELERSLPAMALLDNALSGGSDDVRVRIQVKRPIIGIGAPAHVFLPQAAELLETEAIVPRDADVANAIGAITSSVQIHKQVRITPNDVGAYSLHGLPDAPSFVDFQQAHAFAVAELQRGVREMARQAGTSQSRVEIVVDDRLAHLADGGQIFVGRTLEARLSGSPDLARLTTSVGDG